MDEASTLLGADFTQREQDLYLRACGGDWNDPGNAVILADVENKLPRLRDYRLQAYRKPVNGAKPPPVRKKADPGAISVPYLDYQTARDWQYLWPGHLPLGELVLIGGAPEAGKGLTVATIIALAGGGKLPDGGKCESCESLVVGTEDHLEKTLIPRVMRAGAPQNTIRRLVVPPGTDALTAMRHLIEQDQFPQAVKVIVVDPITSGAHGLAGDINSANAARAVCEGWTAIAREIDGVVIGIIHTAKYAKKRLEEGRLTDLIGGSQQWTAVARFVLGLFPETETGDRLLMRLKCNDDSVNVTDGWRIRVKMSNGNRVLVTPFTVEKNIREAASNAVSGQETGSLKESILDYLAEQGEPVKTSDAKHEIAERTGKAYQSVGRAGAELAKAGALLIVDGGRGKQDTKWTLPSSQLERTRSS